MQTPQARLHILPQLIYPQEVNDPECLLEVTGTARLQLSAVQRPQHQDGPVFIEMREIYLRTAGREVCEES